MTDRAKRESGEELAPHAHEHVCALGHPHPIVKCRCLDCGDWFEALEAPPEGSTMSRHHVYTVYVTDE